MRLAIPAPNRTHGAPPRTDSCPAIAVGVRAAVERRLAALCYAGVVRFCRVLLRLSADWRVEGLDHVPSTGPVVLAARHVHHALDGALLLSVTPRRLHAMVAVDWARPGPGRWLIERGCRLLEWPTVLRSDHPGAGDPDEAARMLRRAAREAIALLRDGQTLLVFPEGYPNIDPHWTPKADRAAWLTFDDGFARLVHLAERDGAPRVAIVPVGFHYGTAGRARRGWRIVARFGAPRFLPVGVDRAAFVAGIEAAARALSAREAEVGKTARRQDGQ
jgi:1-acyl-sn-glycerol-3-phosphate acyltransferase